MKISFASNLKNLILPRFPWFYRFIRKAYLLCVAMNPAEYFRYRYCVCTDRPYFGRVLASNQGSLDRYEFMHHLVQLENGRKTWPGYNIMEIGSWAGGSAIVWADAIRKYNHGKGRVICVDLWESYFDLSKDRDIIYRIMSRAARTGKIMNLFLHNMRTSGFADHVLSFKGPSDEVLPLLQPDTFALVYIDAAHAYDNVIRDIRNAAPLVQKGGILCGDDLEMQVSECDPEFAEKNKQRDYLMDPKTQKRFHPGVAVAVHEFFGEVSCWSGFWAMRKTKGGWEKISMDENRPRDIALPPQLL